MLKPTKGDRLILVAASLTVLSLAACQPVSAQAKGKHASGPAVNCKLEQVKDAQRSNLVAFTYLVPKGWTAQAVFNWNPGGQTYGAELGAHTEDKQYGVDNIQPMNIPYLSMTGAPTRGMRLTHATDFLHALVERAKKSGLAKNIQIVSEFNSEIPATAQQQQLFDMASRSSKLEYAIHESGYLKVTYELNGVEETADLGTTLFGTLGFAPALAGHQTETGNYVAGPTLMVSAPTHPSAQKVKEAQIVASSLRMTPEFSNYCWKLVLAMGQSRIDAGNRTSKELANEWHERSMANFRDRMAAKDAHCRDFCDYVLDQQQYVNPGGGTVTLPSNYNHVWTNGNGEYIMGNDPSANPGSGWQSMQKKPLGG